MFFLFAQNPLRLSPIKDSTPNPSMSAQLTRFRACASLPANPLKKVPRQMQAFAPMRISCPLYRQQKKFPCSKQIPFWQLSKNTFSKIWIPTNAKLKKIGDTTAHRFNSQFMTATIRNIFCWAWKPTLQMVICVNR